MSKKLPCAQPGAALSAFSRYVGTIGPLALTKKGEIVMITTSHQLGPARKEAILFLLPEKIPISHLLTKSKIKFTKEANQIDSDFNESLKTEQIPYDSSFRIKGIEDDLPVVLKKPIKPEIGRKLIKSGAATGVTQSEVLDSSKEIEVQYLDGSEAKFADQIMTGYMGTNGDSGSFVLTKDTFEPVGLLFAGNSDFTFHNKITYIEKTMDLMGFFCPISLPTNTPPILRFIVSSIIPDGFFMQKASLLNERPEKILEQLGIIETRENPIGGFEVVYEDMILTNHPHMPGDEGGLLFSKRNKVVGLAVGGNDKTTVVIKIHKVLKALNLELITNFTLSSFIMVHESGYWRTRCKICSATIAPGSTCHFCKNVEK